MAKLYFVYGLIVVGLMGFADYRGWTFPAGTMGQTVPKSVRDNPGSYRPAYGSFRHFFGGK
ncbi:MAG TPA: hypothetical protein VH583_02430 [Vicinamibacterales bacterium]|jgi:hypothetical protein